MGTKEELAEMFDALERTTEKTDAPSTDAPVVDDEVKTDAPKTSAPVTDAPKEGDDKTDAPSTDAPEDELTKVKREADELRNKLAEFESTKTKTPKTKAPSTDAPIIEEDFVKDIDLDEVTREPSAFNKLLNKIYTKAIQTVRGETKKAKEETLQTIPDIVVNKIELQKSLKEMSDRFYNKNKDLEPFKRVVGVVFEELAAENPKAKYNEVLEKVGVETRKRLGLKEHKVEVKPKSKSDDESDPPPLPRKKGGRVTQPKPGSDSVISQIDEMNKTLQQ